ncbi:MAG TPA: hypothetical protein VH439_17170 [Gemmatimonadales bacterium]|jgi:hypothetical protein
MSKKSLVTRAPTRFVVKGETKVQYVLWYWGRSGPWHRQAQRETLDELRKYHAYLWEKYPGMTPWPWVMTKEVIRTESKILEMQAGGN